MNEYVQKRLATIKRDHGNPPTFDELYPPRAPDETRKQRIYVIPCREFVKVGISRDPLRRWIDLRVGNPLIEPIAYESELVYRACLIETQVHHELRPLHLRGEWFQCAPEVAIAAIQRLVTA